MKVIALLTMLAASLSSPLLCAAEPGQGSDQPAAKTTPAKAGPSVGDDTDAPAGADKAAKDKVAPEHSPAATSKEPAPAKSAADKSAADKASADKASPQRFVPSEQVRADFDVSFPIDT
jgi:hypothetical protein